MEKKNNKNNTKKPNLLRLALLIIIIIMAVFWIVNVFGPSQGGFVEKIEYSKFYQLVKDNPENNQIKSVTLKDNFVQGQFTKAKGEEYFYLYIPDKNKEKTFALMKENIDDFEIRSTKDTFIDIFYFLGPLILFLFPVIGIIIIVLVIKKSFFKSKQQSKKYNKQKK